MTEPAGPFVDRRWCVDAAAIGTGKRGALEATMQELAAAAKRLGLLECRSLGIDYEFKSTAGGGPGRFLLRARFRADVVQSCIVTLDPLDSKSDEKLEIEFRPEGTVSAETEPEAFDVLGSVDTDTYRNGQIDLGQLAFELLSVSLDPYPRKPGAAFVEDPDHRRHAHSPFSALAQLRKR